MPPPTSATAFPSYGRSKVRPLVVLALCLAGLLIAALIRSYPAESASVSSTPTKARLGEKITIKASNPANPAVHLSDGHELLTAFAGPAELVALLQENQAKPLSLATADFDEDGVLDLVGGYGYDGRGIITLIRGNFDSGYPNAQKAQQRLTTGTLTDAPFLSPALLFPLSTAADFVGAGDFNADGHQDIVVATRGGNKVSFLLGDGRGHLGNAKEVAVDGAITAFITGEINRADGLPDIVIGVVNATGAQVIVLESPLGAMRAKPEAFAMADEAKAFVLGQFDERAEIDLAVAAGTELVIISGRDRKLSLNVTEQSKVAAATIDRHPMPFFITSLAAGNFIWDKSNQTDIALLASDHSVHLLSRSTRAKTPPKTQAASRIRPQEWLNQRVVSSWSTLSPSPNARVTGSVLISARVSGRQSDDLMLLETAEQEIHLINADPAARDETGRLQRPDNSSEPITNALEVDSPPVAVIPMRLNSSAFSSLVVLRSGQTAPAVVLSAPNAIITVNSSADTNIRDSVLTLREAILLSNGGTAASGGLSKAELTAQEQAQVNGTPAPGLDEIRFNIPALQASGPAGSGTILAARESGYRSPSKIIDSLRSLTRGSFAPEDLFMSAVGAGASAQACTYTVSPPQTNLTARAGTTSISVTAATGCGWTAVSNAPWVTITAGSSGTGNGTVTYSVTANVGSARTGTISVAGQTYTVRQAAENEWSSNGPFGGHVEGIRIDPVDSDILYAATDRGVFKSTNAGASWSQTVFETGFAGFHVYTFDVALDPANHNIVYAATNGLGVFKSTNGGTVWQPSSAGLSSAIVFSLIVDPANSDTIYAGTFDGGVFKSTNAGASWTQLNSGLTSLWVNELVLDPTNSNILYAGTETGGIFKSTNKGATWSFSGNGAGFEVRNLIIDPNNHNILYAGSSSLSKTTDGGVSWNPIGSGLPLDLFETLAVDPNNSNTIYVGTDHNGVYKSTDAGLNWVAANLGLTVTAINSLVIDVRNSENIYVGTAGGGVFKSSSGGSWNSSNFGLSVLTVSDLVTEPASGNTLYAGTTGGIFKSTDGGRKWLISNSGLTTTAVVTVVVDPNNTNIIYAGTNGGGIFKSVNAGSNWTPINSGQPSCCVFDLVIDPTNPNTLYAATGNGVFKTTNAGVNWNPMNSGLTDLGIFVIAITPTAGNIVYASTGAGLFKSTNGGANWNPANSGLNMTPQGLAIDPINANVLYAGGGDGVFKSTNGGANWSPSNTGLRSSAVNALKISSSSVLYVGTSGGIFRSINGGASWSGLNAGMKADSVLAFAVDPTDNNVVHAGTTDGVFSVFLNNCNYSIDPVFDALGPSGGARTVSVATTGGCLWSISNDNPWATIDSPTNGSGSGTVSYTVASNPGTTLRSGIMTIAGQRFDLSQTGNPPTCTVTPITIGQTVNGTLTNTDCTSPSRSFSTPTSTFFADQYSLSGTAGQQVFVSLSSAQFDGYLYLLGPDDTILAQDDDGGGGTNSRIPAVTGLFTLPSTGTYKIEVTTSISNSLGSYVLSVNTGSTSCSYSISPRLASFSSGGGTGTLTISSPAGCTWTATNNDPSFITITSGLSGSGNGVVNFSVSPNPGSARTGTLTIAGNTFTVFQDVGSGCTYSIDPPGEAFSAGGGGGTVNVTAPVGCAWIAVSNTGFVSITSNATGSGVGTVTFAVAANASSTARTGTITIAGRTFGVVQGGALNPVTISLLSPLPKIIDPVTIDGSTQPGYAGTPLVIINGAGLTGGGNGLAITAGSSTLRALTITGFASNSRDAAILLITNGGNVVESCYIGSDFSGVHSSGKFGGTGVPLASGISIRSSSGNRIGGTNAVMRNLISGVDGAGVTISGAATSNLIQGNFIGTDVTGNLSLGLQHIGVYVQGANGNTIGGQAATPGTPPGNLISGNIDYGVYLQDDALNNIVTGNLIGSNSTGTVAVPNNAGIFIYNSTGDGEQLNNTIGGTTPAARNIISANDPYGVVLGTGATGTLVQGNYIGTSSDGGTALPNVYGVIATQANGSTIGGTLDVTRNVISGNNLAGISIGFLTNGALGGTGTTIQKNYIGTNANGTGPLPNLGDGVFVEVQSITHVIQDNVIAFNGNNGVRIPNITSNPGTPGVRIFMDSNSIFANSALGIDLGNAGITPNDPQDTDVGGNLQQNFPVLTSAIASAGSRETIWERAGEVGREMPDPVFAAAVTINGTLNSTPNATFTVHWYFSTDAQCTTNQAASRPLAFGKVPNVMTNSNGDAQFSFPFDFPSGITSGIINTTATDALGNTSEFSACFPVSMPARTLTVASANPASGVSVTVSPNDNGSQGNGTTQFTRTYDNNTVVSLTAAATASGNNFQKWLKDGADFVSNTVPNVSVTMDANHTLTAVYVTPAPPGPSIFVEAGTNNLAAVDAVTQVRGPFAVTNTNNFSSDQRTRIIFFTTNLGLGQTAQPDLNTLSVQIGGKSYPVESVGPNTTTGGSQIIFRLPDLSPGTYPLGIRINGVNSANAPNITIVSSPSSSAVTSKAIKAKLVEHLLLPLIDLIF